MVQRIRERNSKPTWIVGFSRGSVDTAFFAKRFPEKIRGIILASGVYTNNSKKAHLFSTENIIGTAIKIPILVVHHAKDRCPVTKYPFAKSFFRELTAPKKHMLSYSGGKPSGRACGPLNHHGFEGIGGKVAFDITSWIKKYNQ